MIAITTFSQSGYELYGKRFLETVIKYWPTKIIVYIEQPGDHIQHEKIEYRNLFGIQNLVGFLQNIQNVPLAHGKTPEGYNYNYDCWKFCRKVFAQLDALKQHEGKAFWLDADIELLKDVPEQFLIDLFEPVTRPALVYLGRAGFHTETGFIGFDTLAAGFALFIDQYERCYRTGAIFKLKRWHDCEAFDWARSFVPGIGRNLSPFYENNVSSLDVLEKTELAEYMIHYKGVRKYGATKIFKGISGTTPPRAVSGALGKGLG